ncbi:uncharacterized protein [Aegilops tauschii subsp. strangulata]|nr:uncharacterized protein LOC109759318 [Aegilops tauschii subsp. strangulata]
MKGRIEVMRSLCKVLDTNFEDKLKELGQWEELDEGTIEWKTVESRLERTIQTLLEVRDERYKQLKECGTKVIQQWKSNDAPASRIVDFSEALAFYDAASATESSTQLTGSKALNIDSIKKINKEILLQNSLELKKLKGKFDRLKNKLFSLIHKNHLQLSLADFVFEMKVESNKDYFSARKKLKEAISNVKAQVVKRKEIIMRTEMLKLAIDQSMPLANIEGFIQVIKRQVDVLVQDEGKPYIYDCEDINSILDKLQSIASEKKAPQNSGSKLRIKELVPEKGMQEKASGTSRASFSLSAANAGKESREKPAACLRSSSRLKEKRTQPELRGTMSLSVQVLPQQESSSSQSGEEDHSGETSRASFSLSAANASKESRAVAQKKPAAGLGSSSRLKETQTQPEMRRITRLSVKVFPQQESSCTQIGEVEDHSRKTSRASSSLSAANAVKESGAAAQKKPAAGLRSSSRLKEKQAQPKLQRKTRVSVQVFPQQESSSSQSGEEDHSGESSLPVEPQLIASLPPHPRQPRTRRVEIPPGEG